MSTHRKYLKSWVVAPLALAAGTVGIALYSHHGVAAAADDTTAGPPPPPPAAEAPPPPDLDRENGPADDRQGPPRRGDATNNRLGPPDPAKMFDLMDTNHDGAISRDEFSAFHAKHRPPFGPEGNRPGRPDGMRGQNDLQGPPPFEKDGAMGQGRDQFGPPPRGEGNRPRHPQDDGIREKIDRQDGECPAQAGDGNRPRPEGKGMRGGFGRQGGEFGSARGPMDDRRAGPPDPANLIKQIDTNGDGTLSQSEIAAFLANHRPPRGSAGEHGAQGPRPGQPDTNGPGNGLDVQNTRPGPPDGPGDAPR